MLRLSQYAIRTREGRARFQGGRPAGSVRAAGAAEEPAAAEVSAVTPFLGEDFSVLQQQVPGAKAMAAVLLRHLEGR